LKQKKIDQKSFLRETLFDSSKKIKEPLMILRFLMSLSFLLLSFQISAFFEREWSHLSREADKNRPIFLWKNFCDGVGEIIETQNNGNNKNLIFRHYSSSGVKLWKKVSNENFLGNVLLTAKDSEQNIFLITGVKDCLDCENTLRAYTNYGIKIFETTFKGMPLGLKINGDQVFVGGENATSFWGHSYNKNSGALLWSRQAEGGKEAKAFDVGSDDIIYIAGKSKDPQKNIFLVRIGANTLLGDNILQVSTSRQSSEKIEALKVKKNLDFFLLTQDFPGTMNSSLKISLLNQDLEKQWERKIASTSGPSQALWSEFFLAKGKHPTVVGSIRDFYNVNSKKETKRAFIAQVNGDSSELLYKSTPNDETYTNRDIYETLKQIKTNMFGDFFFLSENENFIGITKVDGKTGKKIWYEPLGGQAEFRIKDFFVQKNKNLVFTIQRKNGIQEDSLIISYSR